MSVHVTEHAIDRYCERVANVPREHARGLIMRAGRTIELAARFGARTVRMGNGAKLVITGRQAVRVVTVLARDQINMGDCPRLSPVSCGLCGVRCGHPMARACTRTVCPLSLAARTIDD